MDTRGMGNVGWEKYIAYLRASLAYMRERFPRLHALQVSWIRSIYFWIAVLFDLLCGYEGPWQPKTKFAHSLEVDQRVLPREQDQEQVPIHPKVVDVRAET